MSVPISAEYPFDPEVKILRSIDLAPSLVVDVGANTGAFAEFIEDLVGCFNLVLFEPLPQLQSRLGRRFTQARVFNVALSNSKGHATIRVPTVGGDLLLSRATLNDHSEPGGTESDELEVPTLPLDAIRDEFGDRAIGLLKIDVEGHELEVLDGAEDTITRHRPLILIEIEARHHEFPISTVFSRLQTWGYRGFYVDPVACDLRNIDHFDAGRDQNIEHLERREFNRYLNNFFFVHESTCPNFVSEVKAFLESEKSAAETWPNTRLERIAELWLRLRKRRRLRRRQA